METETGDLAHRPISNAQDASTLRRLSGRQRTENPAVDASGPRTRNSRAPQRSIHPAAVVVHPVFTLAVGGLERQLIEACRRTAAFGIRNVLIVRRPADSTDELISAIEGTSIVTHACPRRDPRWSHRLAEELRNQGADLLHVRGFSMLIDALAAAERAGGLPVVFGFHGFERYPPALGTFRRRLYRAAVMRCAARWAVGPAAARTIATELALPPDAFTAMHNGVDGGRFGPSQDRTAARAKLSLPANRPLVLSVGNLKPIKGHEVLLQAARRLFANGDDFTLVLVGRDYSAGRLQRWADDHLPGGHIVFAGAQCDVRPWYAAADVFVLPSHWEGLSNALLEAMACGVAPVATAVGGNGDAILDGQTGLLVPPGDATAMAAALARCLADPGLRARLGRAARQRAVALFSADHGAERIAGGYRQIAQASIGGAW